MLSLENVAVHFSGRRVLRDVSFTLRPGEITAYLGANGSGKTTTVKVLTGLLSPSRGRVLFEGRDISQDPVSYRRRLGYVPETADVYPFLSGREYLQLVGRLRGLDAARLDERIDELLALLGLAEHRYQELSSYSKGMRQKVLLAAALLHDPQVLLLDEPLSGLDVGAVLVVKSLLRELAARGRVVLYSTHLLEIAERLCTRALILHGGAVVADDSVGNVRGLRHSLEDAFSGLVLDEDPERTASRILEVVAGARP